MFMLRSASMARALVRPAILRRGIADGAMNKPAYRLVLVRYVRAYCLSGRLVRWAVGIGLERRPRRDRVG